MKRLKNFLILGAIVLSTVAFISNNKAAADFDIEKAEFLQFLEESKSYSLQLAEAMPADKYSFSPHDSVRTFGEQLAHVGMSTKFLTDMFINGAPTQGPKVIGRNGTGIAL